MTLPTILRRLIKTQMKYWHQGGVLQHHSVFLRLDIDQQAASSSEVPRELGWRAGPDRLSSGLGRNMKSASQFDITTTSWMPYH